MPEITAVDPTIAEAEATPARPDAPIAEEEAADDSTVQPSHENVGAEDANAESELPSIEPEISSASCSLEPSSPAPSPSANDRSCPKALIAALRTLRSAAPNMGVKVTVAKLKALHPEWNIGAKEVRKALAMLENESSADEEAGAVTPEVHIKAEDTATPPTDEIM